jgi:hypothetical protein
VENNLFVGSDPIPVRGFTDTPDVCKVVVMYLQEEYAHRDAALKPNNGTGQAKADELRIPRLPRVLCCRQSGEVLNATSCATAAIRSALRMPSQSKQSDLRHRLFPAFLHATTKDSLWRNGVEG